MFKFSQKCCWKQWKNALVWGKKIKTIKKGIYAMCDRKNLNTVCTRVVRVNILDLDCIWISRLQCTENVQNRDFKPPNSFLCMNITVNRPSSQWNKVMAISYFGDYFFFFSFRSPLPMSKKSLVPSPNLNSYLHTLIKSN